MNLFTESSAEFSPCRRYRYWLQRTWDPSLPKLGFLMLNPSTATETVNDPTVRKCEQFARRHGFGTLVVCNLYAWRSTDPRALKEVDDPVGPDNDGYLYRFEAACNRIICAWGVNAEPERAQRAIQILKGGAECFGVTKDGAPKHPLYLPYSAPIMPYVRDGKLVNS